MDLKAQLIEAGKQMLGKGLTVETWGNISIRDPESGLVYLTPSGMDYDILVPEDIVVSTLDGTIVEGTRKPTIEMTMHLNILKSRPEIHVVIHTHPIYSQVFAAIHQPIPVIIDEAAQVFGGEVTVTEYALPGSQALADNVVAALSPNKMACLMANHGAVCLGETVKKAFKCCTVLEMTAQIYQLSLQVGTPIPLTPENIEGMKYI